MSTGSQTFDVPNKLAHASGLRADALALLRSRQHLALGLILALAAFLNLFRIDREGYSNTYYAATVKSMLTSWHNFFFVSFDPGGFVSVDKPPLGFWIQAASAKLFGFSGLSLLLPEAIAGVLSVALLYHLVRRTFGVPAGLLAALVLAVTPVAVVVNRNNTIDALLILVLLGAVWAVTIAIERGSLRWLLLGALLVGLGFNIKMLQAYLVVPALALAYLMGARPGWRTRLVHLVLAGVVLVVVSLSWAVAVDRTRTDQRPYVGSSENNSALNLALGYNGLFRLLPSEWLPAWLTDASGGARGDDSGMLSPPGDGPSPLRLLGSSLAGQIAWLLPLAALGGIVAWRQTRTRLPLNRRQTALVLWGMWFVTGVCFFSVATSFSLMHRYYLAMLAPPTAALVGAGLVALWRDYRRPAARRWRHARGWLLPLAVAGTAVLQIWILADYPDWSRWMTPLIAGLGTVTTLGLIGARLGWGSAGRLARRALPALAGVGLATILLAPTVWAGYTIWNGSIGAMPAAGPASTSGFGPPVVAGGAAGTSAAPRMLDSGMDNAADPKLIDFLEANRGDTRYLVATNASMTAAPIILATGQPVAALGGFSGQDPILTNDQLAALVAAGEVRFFLMPSVEQAGAGPGFGTTTGNVQWVNEHCTPVSSDLWRSDAAGADTGGAFGRPATLFDCADATG